MVDFCKWCMIYNVTADMICSAFSISDNQTNVFVDGTLIGPQSAESNSKHPVQQSSP